MLFRSDHRCHSIFDLFNITEQFIQREHRYATGEITAPRDCYATFCAALDHEGDEMSPGGRYVASYEYYGEDEPYTDRAEIEYGSAALKCGGSHREYGLAPTFAGINFSDDISSLRNPSYRGAHSSRGGYSGRGRGRGGVESNSGTVKTDAPRSYVDKRNLECYKCHMYGHFAQECQEKEVGYMAYKSPANRGGKPNSKANTNKNKKAKGKDATSVKQVAEVNTPTLNQ